MTIARVIDGLILEMRPIDMADVPEHKRSLWLPVVYEGEGSVSVTTVEPDHVLVTLSAPAAQVPRIISDRQFFQQLANEGLITAEEALAAVGPGAIPASMDAMIESLPEADRFPARMLLTGATQFDKQDPLVSVLSSLFGWSSDKLNAFWADAYSL